MSNDAPDLWSAMANALRSSITPKALQDGTTVNDSEAIKALIESVQHPCEGRDLMWQAAAWKTRALGGTIHMGTRLESLRYDDRIGLWMITAQKHTGETVKFTAYHVISSAPISDLVSAFAEEPACAEADDKCNVEIIRAALGEKYPSLHLVGESAMDENDSQDHAMLSSMLAVKTIVAGAMLDDDRDINDDEGAEEDVASASMLQGGLRKAG
jgi:protoporphyrinogen oxidase